MRAKARLFFLLALASCSASRPEGAFEPLEKPNDQAGFDDDDSDDDDRDDDDTEPVEDAGDGPELDGGEQDDANTTPTDPTHPLAALAGRYLMRVDYYSKASATQDLTTLKLKNRVSNLFFTEIKLVDGKLQAHEQLCDQVYAHECELSCSGWITETDSALRTKYQTVALDREYTVDAQGNLAAPKRLIALGFDDPDPANAELPDAGTDPRVWVLGEESNRRGVHTRIEANLTAAGAFPVQLKCDVNSVLVFGTSFNAKLPSLDAASLSKLTFSVQTEGSRGNAFYAYGTPTMVCNKEEVSKGSSSPGSEKAFVRFKSAGTATKCPSNSEFETAFPTGIDAP